MMFSFSISARMWISFSMSPMATPLLEVSTLFFLMYLTIPIIPSTHSSINTQAADSLHGHDHHTNGYHRQGLEPSSRLIIRESNLLGGILSLCTSFNDAMYNGKLTAAKSHLQNNHIFSETQESVRYSVHEQHNGAANLKSCLLALLVPLRRSIAKKKQEPPPPPLSLLPRPVHHAPPQHTQSGSFPQPHPRWSRLPTGKGLS